MLIMLGLENDVDEVYITNQVKAEGKKVGKSCFWVVLNVYYTKLKILRDGP